MRGILRPMIFFRKKKPASAEEPAKKAEPTPPTKTVKSLQEISHTRVLTAEGWRRSMEKKLPKKAK